ncbi:MAG: DNA mismatch repair protein MutS [Clostridia bacterium]|nr:DNA mismatch repair protein MutS [Clostridia bacterium]
MALSPMMRQYLDVKERYKNAILMFRLGDFYEMFFDDAKIASKELELTLTGRDCGESERAPMCGVPYHAVDSYIGKLVSRGYKVVICEQMEDPATAKGIVRRDVTRIVTKGTVTDITQLDETRNNYICAIYYEQDVTALCFADISTGEMSATTVLNDPDMNRVINELSVYSPNEIISNVDVQKFTKLNDYIKDRLRASFSLQDDSIYDRNVARQRLGAQILSELFFVDEFSPIYSAAGAIISYIDTNLITVSFEAKRFDVYGDSQYLKIDANSRRNLELCETMRDRSNKKGTLLGVLDKTKTSPGARLLRRSIEMPLVNQRAIIYRQDAVEELVNDFILREEIGDCLKEVFDLERLMPKLSYGTAGGRDLRAIHDTLCVIPRIKALLTHTRSAALCDIREKTDSLEDIVDLIASSISDKPPFSVREGGFIADGYSSELDELRAIKKNAKTFLDKIESDEREKTGIKTLKIGFNRVFGYYIEVSKSYKDQVPDYYIRKQTLTNGERYITAELKDLEDTILSADDRINTLEYELFRDVCD